MKLVIGGYAQGKLDYVLSEYGIGESAVWDGVLPEKTDVPEEPVVINRFHRWVEKRLSDGGCPEEEIFLFLERFPDCVIISDEIGNGIVPADEKEREYRERTGRLLVRLAGQAKEVERVICGIAQKIK